MSSGEASHTSPAPLGRLLRVVVPALAVPVVVAACGSGSGGGSTPSATPSAGGSAGSGGSTVDVQNFMFTPVTLTVSAGTTVTWKFDDSTQHTVVANDNSFTSSALANGQTFTHAFGAAGTVPYHCSIHPFMTATIVVK